MLEKYAKHEAIMVVGHNPSITDFLARIIAKAGCEALIDFKKGAVARVETVRHAATLNWFFSSEIGAERFKLPQPMRRNHDRRLRGNKPVLFQPPTVPDQRSSEVLEQARVRLQLA